MAKAASEATTTEASGAKAREIHGFYEENDGKSMGNLWKIPGNGMTLIQGGTPPVLSERWLTKTIGLVCQYIYLINHSGNWS